MYDLHQHDIPAAVLILDIYDDPVRGQDGQAVQLGSVSQRQFSTFLPKYCGAACQQPPEEASFCVNMRRL